MNSIPLFRVVAVMVPLMAGHMARAEEKAPKWPAGGPPHRWTIDTLGLGYSGPTVAGSRLYIAGGRDGADQLLAFDLAADGSPPKEAWAVKIGPLFQWKGNNWNNGPSASPTVAGDLVFALGGFGDLVAVEAATGKERWRLNLPRDLGGEVNPIGGGLEDPTPLGWGYAATPLVDGDRLLVVPGGPRGLLAALDKNTGKVQWRSADVQDQAPYASPVIAEIGGTRQVIQVTNSGIVGVALADGKRLWQYRRDPAYDDVVIATPIVHQGYIFTSVGFQQGCDLIHVEPKGDSYGVKTILSNRSVQNRDGGMVRVDGHVYGHSENGGWFCMELATGTIAWSERNKLPRGPIMASGGWLYCQGETGGAIVQLDPTPRGWTEAGRLRLPKPSTQRRPSGALWTRPVIANGSLYIRDQELLHCYQVK